MDVYLWQPLGVSHSVVLKLKNADLFVLNGIITFLVLLTAIFLNQLIQYFNIRNVDLGSKVDELLIGIVQFESHKEVVEIETKRYLSFMFKRSIL